MDLKLANARCFIGGASRGIGRAIALTLAREGACVAAVARGRADLDTLMDELAPHGGPHCAIVGDMQVPSDVDAAFATALATLGGLDCVVANVGKSFARTCQEMDAQDFANSLQMNLTSSMLVASTGAKQLAADGAGGAILLISSIWGREAGGAPGYNVAKAGVIALGKALARDWAKARIRVNTLAPGSVLFEGGSWARRQAADPEGIAAFVARELPLNRFGTPAEIADVAAFLLSPRASWVNGACVVVDGGQSRMF